jgi:hypothetical protein
MKSWHAVAAIGTGVLAAGAVALFARRAWARAEVLPIYPPDEPPLRPPPADVPIPKAPAVPDGPPGPLASRLERLLAAQSDAELAQARAVMPDSWWGYILAATRAPSDDIFKLVLNPTIVDLYLMTEEERSELEDGIVDAIGLWDAAKLRDILIDARGVA